MSCPILYPISFRKAASSVGDRQLALSKRGALAGLEQLKEQLAQWGSPGGEVDEVALWFVTLWMAMGFHFETILLYIYIIIYIYTLYIYTLYTYIHYIYIHYIYTLYIYSFVCLNGYS